MKPKKVQSSLGEPPKTKKNSYGSPHTAVASQKINSNSPMTFTQKLYQSDEFEIAEEYEQALESNCLEEIIMLLDKVANLRSL